jgi:hypothetical protein
MKSLFIGFLLFSGSAFAVEPPVCSNEAVKTAVSRNFERFGAATSSCGAKLLAQGRYLSTYLVCVTDETDPSEWVVVMSPAGEGNCAVEFADVQYDSESPNFSRDNKDLLPVWTCEADAGFKDGEVICK